MIDTIGEEVAQWVTSYNSANGTDYATAFEAIADGKGDSALYACYMQNTAAWSNWWTV